MTKNELLARAKELNIKGRHDMSVADLETAIRQREMIAANVEAAKADAPTKTRRLVKNTNLPWRRKYYYVDVERYEETAEERKKVASQVQLMLKFMIDREMVDADSAEQGVTIAGQAINTGAVKSKIEPHVLFAYYRKTMEQYGLVFAGYNLDQD